MGRHFGRPLASLLCTVLGFGVVLPLMVFFIVNSTTMAWDYTATIALFHWVLACIVMDKFPTNWVWWVVMIVVNLGAMGLGEVLHYRLVDLRDIKTGN
jgi:hypothetical protein